MEAGYTSDKMPAIEPGNRKVNAVRHLLRLSKDLRLLPVDEYAFASERLEEVGRTVGGSTRAKPGRGAQVKI